MSGTEGQQPAEPAGSTPEREAPAPTDTGVGLGAGEANSFEPEEADLAEDDPAEDDAPS